MKNIIKKTGFRMNKKGLQFRNAFFAILIVGLVVAAFGVIIGEWNSFYDAGLTYDLDNYNGGDSISGTVEGYEGKVSPKTPEIGSDYQSNTLQAAYGIITDLISPFRIVFGQNGMIDAVTESMGIPDYIRITIVTMMILSIIFALVAIVFRNFRTTT